MPLDATPAGVSASIAYAHSTDRLDRSDWETLDSHATAVASASAKNGRSFGWGACAMLGWAHDLGKFKPRFQARLSDASIIEPHAAEGARYLRDSVPGPLGQVMSQVVLGHHGGLPDAGGSGRDLNARLDTVERIDMPQHWQVPSRTELLPEALSSFDRKTPGGPNYALSFFGRMAFSALIDADRSETAAYYDPTARAVPRPDLYALRAKLDETMSLMTARRPIDDLRKTVHDHARSCATQVPGLFTLTVPTGGGKTLTSLGFALDHAIAHGMDRIIFVIPYTSIVEQTADVFRNVFGELGAAAVLEHHASFDNESLPDENDRRARNMAAENWDSPIIVTTAVQFLESLHAASPARCRKLHNIANATVILDEAQALPRHLLRPSLASLKELARGYKSSVVFCTATQPAICREDGFPHSEGLDRVGPMPVRELAPDPIGLYQKLRRVQVTFGGKLSDKEIVEILAREEGGLCIVNNRKHAKALFKACRNLDNVYHLSTNMTATHRRSVLLKVREALKKGPVRLISTSLIEAGVDISFPVVLRENAGMDSIAQAAGRCNREGECDGLGRVIVFETDETAYQAPRDLQLLAAISKRILSRYADDPLSSESIKAYFEEAFWRASHAMDCGTVAGQPFSIMDAIQGAGRRDVQIPYRSIAEAYRLIEDGGVPIIVTGGEWGIDENLLELAAERGDARALARMVQSYQVQVPSKVFAKMLEDGHIEALHKEKYDHQFHKIKGFDGYCEKVGLQWG